MLKCKILRVLSLVIVIIACMSLTVSATDSPWYLNPDSSIDPCLNYIPVKELTLPGTGTFNYSFDNNISVQYSDFLILPTSSVSGIRMKYTATSADHYLRVRVICHSTFEVIYDQEISVLNGITQSKFISLLGVPHDKFAYYIELSNPSISNASGTFTITQ